MCDNNNTRPINTFEEQEIKLPQQYILTVGRQEVSNGLTIINEIKDCDLYSNHNTLMYVGIQTGTGGKIINKLSRK